MKLKDFLNIFSLQRYRSCKKIFTHPLQAHFSTSWGMGKPFIDLEFLNGGKVRISPPHRARKLWQFLFSSSNHACPVKVNQNFLQFQYQDDAVTIRLNTFDFHIFREIFIKDVYHLNKNSKPLENVIDLGGNIGFFSSRIAKTARQVLTVEPVSFNRELAKKNIEGAGVSDKVTLIDRAIGKNTGETIRIYISSENPGSNSMFPEMSASQKDYEEVSLISLEDLFLKFNMEKCDLLKCDIEGAEYDVFEGASINILNKIESIVMEGHIQLPQLPYEKLEKLQKKLKEAGFIYTIEEDLQELKKDGGNYMLFAHRAN